MCDNAVLEMEEKQKKNIKILILQVPVSNVRNCTNRLEWTLHTQEVTWERNEKVALQQHRWTMLIGIDPSNQHWKQHSERATVLESGRSHSALASRSSSQG